MRTPRGEFNGLNFKSIYASTRRSDGFGRLATAQFNAAKATYIYIYMYMRNPINTCTIILMFNVL